MPYLICDECGGYYELQEGEFPDDFDSCQCGGILKYYENMFEYTTYDKYNRELLDKNIKKTEKQKREHNKALEINDAIKREKTYNYF